MEMTRNQATFWIIGMLAAVLAVQGLRKTPPADLERYGVFYSLGEGASVISGDSILATVKALTRESSRELSTAGADRTVAYITSNLRRYGWDVEQQSIEIEDRIGKSTNLLNVVAYNAGSGDSILIICTHYDSRGAATGADAPGADDNASGVAVLMETARVMSRVLRSGSGRGVEFVFFGGEEESFIGSSAFVRDFLKSNKVLLGSINIDMIGYDKEGPKDYVLFANQRSASLADLVVDCSAAEAGLRCEKIITSEGNSDHVPFWKNGFKAVSIWEGFDHNPYNHTAHDTAEKLSSNFMTKMSFLISCAAIRSVLNEDNTAPGINYRALERINKGSLGRRSIGKANIPGILPGVN